MSDKLRGSLLTLAVIVAGAVAYGAWHGSIDRQLARAASLAYEERWAEAAASYRAIIASVDPVGDRQAWVEAHARFAEITWTGLSDARGAAEIYRKLIAGAPDAEESWRARELLAELAERHLGDVHEAIAHWQALAASGRPGADRFAYQAARTYFRLGDYEQARKEAETLVERWPQGAWADDALFLHGSAWQLEGEHEEAIAIFEQVEERFPETEVAGRARYQIGQSRASLRDWDGAQAALLQALESHPDPWQVQADLARVRKHLAEERRVEVGTPAAFR